VARNFDNFPTYDPIIKDNVYLSNVWSDFMATFVESLQGYLTQNGIFVPRLTIAERDIIQDPQNGQMIYVSDTNELQIWKNGSWTLIV